MKILLDMDGVLTDFVDAVEKKYHPFKVTKWNFVDDMSISKIAFWQGCDENFWANLDWTPDGKNILSLVEGKFGMDNICLLTSPCLTAGCREGKWKWIQKYLPQYRMQNLMGSAKEFLAAPNKLLIDDSDSNIEKFAEAGGQTLLVPRIWNYNAKYETLKYVKNELKKYDGLNKSCRLE